MVRSSSYPVVLAYVRGRSTSHGPCPCLRKYVRVHLAHGGYLASESGLSGETQKRPQLAGMTICHGRQMAIWVMRITRCELTPHVT